MDIAKPLHTRQLLVAQCLDRIERRSFPGRIKPEAHANRIAAPLTSLGLTEKDALTFQAAVISFALGWESFEANGPMRDFLRQIMDFDASFAVGLDALVAGFAAQSVSRP